MAKYNKGGKYNLPVSDGGIRYNSPKIGNIIKLNEAFGTEDANARSLAMHILSEKLNFLEQAIAGMLHKLSESFSSSDKSSFSVLQKVLEAANTTIGLSDFFTMLYLSERFDIIEELKKMDNYIRQKELFASNENISIDALISIADKAELKLAEKLFHILKEFEYTGFTDRSPRKAISDFLIGNMDNIDKAYEYFLPLGMIFDPERSEIQVMPQTETTYIEMPYMDGSVPESTVYKNRFFNIVAWSQDGLNTAQKEQLKADIARVLDSTKDKPKKLTIQKSNISFDVKYSGLAEVKSGPSFVKATIPLESQPYGHYLFDQSCNGSGLIVNSGDTDAGVVNEIFGKCENPSFRMRSTKYIWNGTVPEGAKLVIDNEALMCYIEYPNGKREGAEDRLVGDYQTVPKGATVVISADENTESHLRTSIRENILWKG